MRLVPAALLILALATPAAAQNRGNATAQMGREFATTDANGDGSLSLAEVQARIAKMRTAKSRFSPEQSQGLARLWFTRADRDRNGRVTKAEADTLLTTTFRQYDTNRDGRVTDAERAAARAEALKEVRGK